MSENSDNSSEQNQPQPVRPFAPLEGETPRAFEAFLCYFETPNRTLAKVVKEVGASEHTVGEWSAKFKWRQRISEYLSGLSSLKHAAKTEAEQQQAAAIADLHKLKAQSLAELAAKMNGKGPEMLEHLLRTNPGSIRLHEITRYIMATIQVGAMAVEEAAEDSRPADKGRRTSSQYDADLRQVYGIKKEIPPSEQPPSAGAETPPSASPEPPPDEQKS
ncbi:MAG TPA: hypothetical protein VK633_12855 [Verrucomicrobiae bacterium]|nr:hypothetical protein [Verrucomicrobiae bacterium]